MSRRPRVCTGGFRSPFGALRLAGLVLAVACASVRGANEVTLRADTEWSGTVWLSHRLVVPEGVTLTIAPGTVVELRGHWDAQIIVKGKLEAAGSKRQRIWFRAGKESNYWSGIVFEGRAAGGTLAHCLLENGRRVAIHCNGASPTIRDCRIMNALYGGGGIFCERGAAPLIARNTIAYKGGWLARGAILCDKATPTVEHNTFENYVAGIQLFGLARKPRLRVRGNALGKACQLLLLDEADAGPQPWRKVFESDVVTTSEWRFIEPFGKRGRVTALAMRDMRHVHPSFLLRYVLEWRDGAYRLEVERLDPPRRAPVGGVPPRERVFAAPDGRIYRLLVVVSGAGAIWREGCMDTKPAYLVLLAGKEGERRLCWRSPKFARGHLRFAAVDLDGDRDREIVVSTLRWCEGKGQVHVFRCHTQGSKP